MNLGLIRETKAQNVQCDTTDLQKFFKLYGGQSSFSAHSVQAVTTFVRAEDLIDAHKYAQAKVLIDSLFQMYPKGSNIWWNVFSAVKGANIGTPHAYYGLRMMEDIIDYGLNGNVPAKVNTIKMKVVLVGFSKGIQPTNDVELMNGTGPFITNKLNANLAANDYCILKQSFQLFSKYIKAITKGQLKIEVEFVELPNVSMNVSVTKTQPYIASGSIQPVWDSLSKNVKENTDFWLITYPSHVPDFPVFATKSFITGGMGQDERGGPVFIADDKWIVRKPAHLGSGLYNDIERRIYLPQWVMHEFYHHLFRIFPEYKLEINGHDWFDRNTWPSDFVGQFEPDYYTEALHKRIQKACIPLTQRLITRQETGIQPYYDSLIMQDLLGEYSLDNITNDWHIGQIIKSGNNYFWKNNANVQWSVTPKFDEGILKTGADCPYLGQDFFIEFYKTDDGLIIPGIKGLKFSTELYRKRFNLLRKEIPLEIVLGLHENKCLDSIMDYGSIIKQGGQFYWQNAKKQLSLLKADLINEKFAISNSGPSEIFNLEIVENECGIAYLGYKYINNYFWKRKRNELNPSPVVNKLLKDIELKENFGSYTMDVSNVFKDVDGEKLYLYVTTSNPSIISATISGGQLILTGNPKGAAQITLMALDYNGGLVMQKFNAIVRNPTADQEIENEIPSIIIDPNNEHIVINNLSNDSEVSIYSMEKLIQHHSCNNESTLHMDVKQLAAGIYFIVIAERNNAKEKSIKWVKF